MITTTTVTAGATTKLFAGKSLSSIVLAAVTSFGIGESITGRIWIALSLSAASTVLIALINNRPRMIIAKSTADTTASEIAQKEIAQAFDRSNRAHADHVAFLNERIVQQNKLLSLMTITKHAVNNESQRLQTHADELEDLLRSHGITFPRFVEKPYGELTRKEDEIRAEIIGIPLPDL